LWEAWDSTLRESPSQIDIGIPFGKLWEFLLEEGWRSGGEKQTFEYTYELSPESFLDAMRRRVWSRCWRLTDEEIAPAIAAVRAVIDEQFDDPGQPVSVQTNFSAQAYLPPLAND
jgi:hypothetical protein